MREGDEVMAQETPGRWRVVATETHTTGTYALLAPLDFDAFGYVAGSGDWHLLTRYMEDLTPIAEQMPLWG